MCFSYTKSAEPEKIFTRLLLGHSLWTFYRNVLIGCGSWGMFLTPNLSPPSMETCLSSLLLLSLFLSLSLCHWLSVSRLQPLLSPSVWLVLFQHSLCKHYIAARNITMHVRVGSSGTVSFIANFFSCSVQSHHKLYNRSRTCNSSSPHKVTFLSFTPKHMGFTWLGRKRRRILTVWHPW